jgi:hypothetical protein
MDVLRPIAEEALKNPDTRSRIWSGVHQAWGFFDKKVSEADHFMVWCASSPGDRILLDASVIEDDDKKEACIILAVWKDTEEGSCDWKMRLMASSGQYFDIKIQERRLFESALKLSGMRT